MVLLVALLALLALFGPVWPTSGQAGEWSASVFVIQDRGDEMYVRVESAE